MTSIGTHAQILMIHVTGLNIHRGSLKMFMCTFFNIFKWDFCDTQLKKTHIYNDLSFYAHSNVILRT